MDLNFSKKTRKIVASLLAVAILLGVLPVSGLTGNSSGAESSSSENSTKTIYVNSTKQPILFDSVGNFKEIIPKVKKNIYSTEAENGDKIALFTDIGNGNSVVFYKTTEWTPSAYMWKEDSSENPDKNAAWPGEAMKKYGDSNSSLYYYVYGSAKGFDKVIFNDGNDQKNGDQTDNKDLKAWNVYTKTSAGRPICDSLTKCDVSDNFNVYEYADSKLSGKNISAPQGMGATIEIAGTKYTVCGDGAKSEITCYEDDEITSLTANTVDGYTAKVTNSVVGDNQITYSVTYTNKTYGMQFSVENTVAFIKNPRLVLEGKWTVTFNGKKYENGDTICNQKDSVKNLEAAFKIDSVTFNGKEISGYDAKTTLNGNSFDSSCGSNELEKENKLVATVYYEADNGKKYSAKSEFSFNYAEGDVTLSENGNDNSVYFDDNNNIYTNSDSVTLTLNDESKIEDLTLELYKGDSTPDSKNKIENAIEFDHEKGTITIGNKDVKLSEIKKATLTITSSKYNLSKTYTISYDTISKDNLKYSNTNENNENNERYYVNAEKGVTVTFNLDGIDKKLFNDENAEVTCDKENGVKISFNKDNKEWKATITKSADYTFTFSNNGFVQTVKIIKQDLYLDDKAPEITGFSFQKAQSDTDKLLSFLTFGIYSNDKIIVTVNAKDEDILSTSSGIKNITLYDDGKILGTQTFNDYSTENTATFTLDESDKAYKLYAVVEDAVGYKSQKTTFDLGKKKDKDSYDVIEYNSEDSNGCLPELVSYSGNDKFSDLAVTPNEALKTYEKGNLFGYNAKDEAFKLELSESLSALSEATVTVSKEGSAKSFSTNPPITFNTTSKDAKKENCKLAYNLKLAEVFKTIGVSKSNISGNYTITVVATNNAGVSRVYTYDFSIDNTAPTPQTFTISDESDTDKILKFLTFGIYSKKEIKVNVTANDENPSSGIASYTLYDKKGNEYSKIADSKDGAFTIDSRDKAYNLFVTVTDKFENTSDCYTFEYKGSTDKNKVKYNAIKSSKAPEIVRYDGKDKFSDKLTVTPEKFEHHYEKGNLFSYKNNGEFFKIELSESLSALSEATVTVSKEGSTKLFTTNPPITFDTTSKDARKDNCKLDYDLKLAEVFDAIGVSKSGISGKYTITVVATNNAGVRCEPYKYDFSIDNTAPEPQTFTISGESPKDKILKFLTFGIYSKKEIKVNVTANDENPSSGISSYTLYDKKDGEYNKLANVTITNSENSKFAEFTIDNRNKEYNLFVTVTDKFDNTSNYYTFDYTGYEKDSYDAIKSSKAPEVVRYDGKDKFSDKLTVTPENFKHQSDKLFSYKENGEAFKLELSESLSALSEATVTVNKDGSEKEFSDTITFVTTSKDAKKKDCKLDYDLKLAKVFNDIGVSGSDISGKYTIKVKATNNASVTRDDYTYEFSIDNTAPVITLFAIENGSQNPIVDETSSQEYRYYFQHNTNVTVTAKDSASGVKEIHFRAYDVVKKDNAVDETKTVSSNNNAVFEVPANFKGEIYAYAVDKFDNSSIDKNIQGEGEKKPDDLIVETQQHHNGNASVTMSRAKASYKDNSGLDLYSGNVNARVVFEDTYAGIKDATITVYDYTNAVTGTIYAEIGNDGSIEKTEVTGSVNNIIFNDDYTTSKDNLLPKLVIDYVVTNNSNNIKITTSMTDRAGNKTDNVKDSLSIDKTKPVIDVKYDNNEHTTYGGNDYYKADRTATVTVTERNFDESLVEAAIMRNGGRYTTIGGWTHNNNTADPDKSTHVAKIVYNTDGDFTFDIAVKDKAMNSADKFTQQKFTVDKTAPVIDVSFDNNSAKNGNYYKADRTATIKITEHNFNSGSQYVNIPVTAEGTTAPSVVGWSGSGDDHNATVSFNKDGKYSFTVDYTDLAGNKAVQKKVDSFYIDKTAPEVEITGVADHQAYNGTVAPVVTYRDDNFTDDHDFRFTKIDINGKSDDTSKFDYDTGGNGVTEFIYKYRDFAEVLENDGIYNFTVELSDKAGNSTSKSVTFSVNRFGSTFKASDESKKLINNGYTNAEQDIVIEEINVTPLTKHSVTLAKSGGNSTELVENTDYTFTSSNNGNEWCKSVYTVNKKNFSDEAAYTVTIMSVDKAKNTNNNRMADSSLSTEQKNKRECAISFVVDKTSPLVSITGIKDNELYKEASKKVKIVCEDDNLDKSKLVVTLDNKKLAEGEDYTIVDDKDGSIAGMLTAEIVLKAETGGIKENLKVTIGDLAGNTGEKSVDNFILSANIFQRFFANPVLVICTFAGLALVIAAVIFFVVKKRKKAE
nr:starch-binding protein [Ruminococcus bromii]